MSDAEQRAWAREVLAGGGVEAEVADLVARLRAGSLSRERVALAAFLGDAAAAQVLGAEAPTPIEELGRTFHLMCVKNARPRELAARGLVAAAQFELEEREGGGLLRYPEPTVRRLLETTEAWCGAPQERLRVRVARSHGSLNRSYIPKFVRGGLEVTGDMAVRALKSAAAVITTGVAEEVPWVAASGIANMSPFRKLDAEWRVTTVDPPLRAAVVAELLPWVLGRGDPIAARTQVWGTPSR